MRERLRSHPHLFLGEHVDQINMALEGIFNWHSQTTITPTVREILKKVVYYHDLGKGTAAFQEFIGDPLNYKGSKNEKSHTLLSFFFTLAKALEEDWNELDAFILAAAVKGHHGRLPTISEKKTGGANCPEWDIDNFAGGERARLIKKQLTQVDYQRLSNETGINLDNLFNGGVAEEFTKLLMTLKKYLSKNITTKVLSLSEKEAVDFRLRAQLIFSIFLEADKAFLAVSDPALYLRRDPKHWEARWIDRHIGEPAKTETNKLRQKAKSDVIDNIERNKTQKIYSMTAPTGLGKTLLAATWAFTLKENITALYDVYPKIIVVLPFLSVIDQTAKEYERVLKKGGHEADGAWLLTSHSIADRNYAEWLEEGEKPFYVDTWRTELIITTYDRFLMSLMEPASRHQMRFHSLCDALIILDEVQSLPCKLWQPLDKIFHSLSETCNTRILLMSATLPPFVKDAALLLPAYKSYFARCERYKLILRLREKMSLEEFCEELEINLSGWKNKRVLITLNTRQCARKVRDALVNSPVNDTRLPVYFISADVTPGDRLKTIKKIKDGTPCIVVSTQCIEAGVDIDMDLVIRDFAPLDSLIQIAGRCNREGKKKRCSVEIVDLVDEEGNRYSEMIYDCIHLQVTRELLEDVLEVPEEKVLKLSYQYFQKLFGKKDTGYQHLKRFARWQDDESVQELLRGKKKIQYTFLVIQQDPSLKEAMANANRVKDRWERREAWRKMAGRIAMISVSVYAKLGFYPERIADEYLGNCLLREGYYSSDCGLLVEGETMIL